MAAICGWIPAATMYNRRQKHFLGSTVKKKESGAVFGEILRFLLLIQGFFPAVDKIPGIRCSPESSEVKMRPVWSYSDCIAYDLLPRHSIDIQ